MRWAVFSVCVAVCAFQPVVADDPAVVPPMVDDAVTGSGNASEGSAPNAARADQAVAERTAFFEARIRPVLIEHCYSCHSAEADTVQGGLRLDLAATSRHGGDSGPAVVAGKPDKSLLLSAMKYEDYEMPPDRRLPKKVIADFERWIQQGAIDPREGDVPTDHAAGLDIEEGRNFWAFQPPEASNATSATSYANRIDDLIRQRLSAERLHPAPPADRRILLRRVTRDLTGLPPSAEDVDRFVNDDHSEAYAREVDRLLASDRYGERWARMWLDVARYAEDQAHIVGNNKSLFYPNAYRYRDWVIEAFNANMPYDDFIRLQLAADLLEPDSDRHTVALGFIGLGPKYYRRNDPEAMADEWEDRVDVVARGLQGMTVACARCHDHKYDPIATEDYYALAGVFAGTEMFNSPLDDRKETDNDGEAKNPEEALHIIRDGKPQNLAVMIRGDVKNRGDVVPRGFLQVVFPGERRVFQDGAGRRELAECLTDPSNPLTARVFVNRVWQQYFGRGIVGTPSNFGELGERPTHPDLLDDLAVGFLNNGWDIKWLHRNIVLSATYQQSSERSLKAVEVDPTNQLLASMPRRRLSVEGWRDAVLTVSGQLSSEIGGPSIRPDDPELTRRTIYSEVSRFQLNPLLSLFDFPDPNTHAASRVETNTPLQKLFLMNSPFMMHYAEKIVKTVGSDDPPKERVQALFRRVLQRQPDGAELDQATSFLKARPDDGLPQLAQALLASNEFWFVD